MGEGYVGLAVLYLTFRYPKIIFLRFPYILRQNNAKADAKLVNFVSFYVLFLYILCNTAPEISSRPFLHKWGANRRNWGPTNDACLLSPSCSF